MLYLEELVDAVIAEEGQTLMGLDFLVEALNLPMKKIELIFKKAIGEYSERRPMKKTEVINTFDYSDGETGYITMPEGTTSCRVARYGVLPNQMPRFYMPKFSEQNVEFDPTTLTCRIWPPVMPMRLTYTQVYVPTNSVLIERKVTIPYSTDEVSFDLETMYGGKSLLIQKAVVVEDEDTGEMVEVMKSMTPTGFTQEEEEFGETTTIAVLSGTLGTGTVNLKTREVQLEMDYDNVSPLLVTYYPKYSVVKELNIGNYIFTKLFASKLLTALASLRAQASQQKLHNIDLTTDNLYERAEELKKEVNSMLKSTLSYGDTAPM